MIINYKVIGILKKYIDDAEGSIEIKEIIKIRDVIKNLSLPEEKIKIILVDGIMKKADVSIKNDNKEITFIPFVSGG